MSLSLIISVGCNGNITSSLGGESPEKPGDDSSYDCVAGEVGLHRLTPIEYDKTLHTLLGITSSPSSLIPSQGKSDYDNIATVYAGTTPELLEKFVDVSESVMDEAFEENRSGIVTCSEENDTCARNIISSFARRAFRRSVTADEIDMLIDLLNTETEFDAGLKLAFRAIISSPSFLFRPIAAAANGGVRRLNSFEVATRMSYFLTGDTPDDALLDLAETGSLNTNEGIQAQARAMFADEQTRKKITIHFTNLLLDKYSIAKIKKHEVEPGTFPDFSDELKDDMFEETRLFLEDMISNGKSPLDMLKADYSFINERLAEHYGVDGVEGDEFRKVSLAGNNRMGILTQGSILTMNSQTYRTSIINRGVWINEKILCTDPPAPNAAFDNVPRDFEGTRRDIEEAQRSSSGCASCHALIDPPGFAMDSFDAVGIYRTEEFGLPIDTSGELLDGTVFEGPFDLAMSLSTSASSASCISKHLLGYSTGQIFGKSDTCNPEAVAHNGIGPDMSFEDLVVAVVTNKAFLGYKGKQ